MKNLKGRLRIFGWIIVLVLLQCACKPAQPVNQNLIKDFKAVTDSGLIQAVIEVPAGSIEKWEVNKNTGKLEWDQENGENRIVQYLGYPVNYGMIPRTLLSTEEGGDGDPLDLILLGPALERGSVVSARLIGLLKLSDHGEKDDKIIAVLPDSPFGEVYSCDDLKNKFPGLLNILELWFSYYKGRGVVETQGFGTTREADSILGLAVKSYESQF